MNDKEQSTPSDSSKEKDTDVESSDANGSNPKKWGYIIITAIIVIGVAIFGMRYYKYATTHVSTDDAFLTADIIQISPQVSGTVEHVYVKDNQYVKAGDLLVDLDDSTYKVALQQAKANLQAAIAAAEGSHVNVAFTGDTGNAQIMQAKAAVEQADSAIGTSLSDVNRTKALVSQTIAGASGAQANISTAEAAVASALAQKKRADAAVEAASAQVQNAEAAVKAANAALESAKAVSTKANKDNERYQKLLAKDVIGAQAAEQAAVAAQTAKSQLDAAYEQVNSSRASLNARQADLQAAKEQVNAANAAIKQSQAQLSASKSQYNAATAGVSQSKAQLEAATKAVAQAEAKKKQALGQLAQANTAPKQVQISKTSADQAIAKVKQALAAFNDAKLRLSYTKIYAPVSGRVNKRSVERGILVQPGTPLMALVPPPPSNIWVTANYKETQLAKMRVGQQAQIKVDALPGRIFNAKVDSIASGTGAVFALLPPDNATGNFTKVVQRIPVKLVIYPDQRDIKKLRAGMSVTATVALR